MAKVFADDGVLNYLGQQYFLSFTKSKVYDTGGNNNGQLDPGETATLTAFLRNIGGTNFTSLNSTLSTTSSYITVTDNSGVFGTLLVDSTKENSADRYGVQVRSNCPLGHKAPFRIIAFQNTWADTFDFQLKVGSVPPTDTGRYFSYYSGGPWQQCPVYSWFAIDTSQTINQGVSLDPSDDQTFVIDLPFTFKYYGTNYTQVSICSNGWVVLGSTTLATYVNTPLPNTGAPPAVVCGIWDDLYPPAVGPGDVYYYSDATRHRFVVEWFKVEHLSQMGYPETFEIILYDPAYYPTPTGDGEIIVQYKEPMHLTSNTVGIQNASQNVGIQYYYEGTYHADAVPLTASRALKYTTWPPTLLTVGDNGLNRIAKPVISIYPNPARRNLNITLQTPAIHHVTLRVYDLTGRQVKDLSASITPPTTLIKWDCKDGSGRTLPQGVYFLRLSTPENVTCEKVILVK